MPSRSLTLLLAAVLLAACDSPAPPASPASPPDIPKAAFDPLATARASTGRIANREAVVPPQCYTKTGGVSNPCWTCHTPAHGHNHMDDAGLQERYAFSTTARDNHWSNLFVDRGVQIAAISDAEILDWARRDNYAPLRAALGARRDYLGWRPDLDIARGFDADGFARDGSDWRAFRYKPFPGTFWPTNGSTDDIFIRLPPDFRRDTKGLASRSIYAENLAILEAAITAPEGRSDKHLPGRYRGGAQDVTVVPGLYPQGTEFLHSVRYLDPEVPDMLARRMKELRYSIKALWTAPQALEAIYADERRNKGAGVLPHFVGTPETGLLNDFGWTLQGFIEDAQGRLRLQTHEEHIYCMGCHSTLGVTVDQTFGFPRKLPGARGWGYQSLEGQRDVPQAGSQEPEVLRYFARVGGGDEFRANGEVLARFFPGGVFKPLGVRNQDLRALLLPSPARALQLNKAYLAIVREQSFTRGRDAMPSPAINVHRHIDNEDTDLKRSGRVFRDGKLRLEWPAKL